MISIGDLEENLFNLDGIRVIIRANKKTKLDKTFNFKEKCNDNITLEEWLKERVIPIISGKYDILVINGYGNTPHMYTKLSEIRKTYVK